MNQFKCNSICNATHSQQILSKTYVNKSYFMTYQGGCVQNLDKLSLSLPTDICLAIKAMNVSSFSNRDDFIAWDSNRGELCLRIAYSLSTGPMSDSLALPSFHWGWKPIASLKVVFFFWECCHNSAYVREILSKRGINIDTSCPYALILLNRSFICFVIAPLVFPSSPPWVCLIPVQTHLPYLYLIGYNSIVPLLAFTPITTFRGIQCSFLVFRISGFTATRLFLATMVLLLICSFFYIHGS